MNRRRTTCPQLGQAIALGCGALLAGCGAGPSGDGFESAIFSEVRVIGSRGNAPGLFVKPRSIAIDRDDNVYVCDMTGRVQKFHPMATICCNGRCRRSSAAGPRAWRSITRETSSLSSRITRASTTSLRRANWFRSGAQHGRERGELSFPRAVAIAPDGSAFVSEFQIVERLQKFGLARESVQVEIHGAGHGPGEFNRAEGLSLDATGKLYVADSCNHRVQVFDGDGAFLREHGGPGAASGEFSYPYDVRVDEQGRQYVCEFGNSRVTVLDADDQVLEIIGGAGSKPGQFNNPWSLALDSRGNLYVADSQNHRVQKLIRREPATEFQLSSSPN